VGRAFVSTALVSVAFGVFVPDGSASCVRSTEAQRIAISTVIFEGIALPAEPPAPPAEPAAGSGVPRPAPWNDVHRFQVTRYLKGSGPAVVSVATMSNTSVGVRVTEGSAWRIFAQGSPNGTLQTNACLGSRPLPLPPLGSEQLKRCRQNRSCPSEHATYRWRGLLCVSRTSWKRNRTFTHRVVNAGKTYFCKR
jgi:hypothetical protein